MPISPARKVAYQILLRMESGRGFAVDLLQSPEVSALKEADRRLATEIVMGVLRWRGELDFQIEQLSGRSVKGFDLRSADDSPHGRLPDSVSGKGSEARGGG